MKHRLRRQKRSTRGTVVVLVVTVASGLIIVPALAAAGRILSHTHCPSIVSGVATDANTGAVMAAGVSVLGVTSDGTNVLRAGAVPCLGGSALGVVPGDCNGDQAITLADYVCLEACLDGPASAANAQCALYDLDNDGSVTHADYGQFQQIFGTGVGN